MSGADDMKNSAEKLGGKAKEGFGKLTDNEKLEAEGQADQVKADAKQAGENVKDAAGKAGDSVKDAFNR
ncbi:MULTISPECIES: CsbD family protein [Micrococcales]|uniref:CsbD family protein n=2 Tax=Actinomycetes TaxID=1760 RepID=UPI000C7B1DB5|nr:MULTISPECIES: CsbD family protein [Micrococcales]MCT1365385.1 CsbD family protein [Microbacterium sp. p3-SID131]MCZ0709206.1 CsbD family protein [Microbacterium paraoxydans]MDH5134002.1 CsbD family protein [Microbacterium sp. RD10]MDH5136898.1 CsbD family protein [Microbacterium sp. RD11]MDH5144129.1 CsbD family protein [Microbacterium sp. RD12]